MKNSKVVISLILGATMILGCGAGCKKGPEIFVSQTKTEATQPSDPNNSSGGGNIGLENKVYENYVNSANSYVIGQLGEDTMPIMTYCSPTQKHSIGFKQIPSMISDKYYTLMQDCGINLVRGHRIVTDSDGDGNLLNLEMCKKYGMAYIQSVSHEGFWKFDETQSKIVCYEDYSEPEKTERKISFVNEISHYKDHPAFAGVSFSDEEGIDVFPGIGSAKQIFKSVVPNKLFFNNLLGQQATGDFYQYGQFTLKYKDKLPLVEQGSLNFYDRYLNSYSENVGEVISYDAYPILKNGILAVAMQNLSIVAQKAKDKNLPYFYCIQASQPGDAIWKIPEQVEQTWHVNSALLFGVKGLSLFTFFTPVDFAHVDNFGACIDYDGNVTPYYDIVKNSMAHIPAMDDYLMKAKWQGVMESSNQALSACKSTISSVKLTSFKECTSITSSQTHTMMGCFDYNGKAVFFVFNNSTSAPTNATLNFSKDMTFKYIKGGTTIVQSTSNKTLNVSNIKAGEAVLLVQE